MQRTHRDKTRGRCQLRWNCCEKLARCIPIPVLGVRINKIDGQRFHGDLPGRSVIFTRDGNLHREDALAV